MPLNRKRKYSIASRGRRMTVQYGKQSSYARRRMNLTAQRLLGVNRRVNQLTRMIETKEGCRRIQAAQVAHNNVYLWNEEVLQTVQGTGDPMGFATGNRIGDKITVKGISAKFFVEGSLGRSKVYFRIMLLRGHRGAAFNRADIYKGMTDNKMIDQINTEKYTILAQKVFTVQPPNAPADSLNPINGEVNATLPSGITGNRIVSFWVPGRKFGRDGIVTFENASGNPKFYDYRWVVVCYDWFGTPQDLNTVGYINEAYNKIYYKDA